MSIVSISAAINRRIAAHVGYGKQVTLVKNAKGALIPIPPLLHLMSVRTQRSWCRRNRLMSHATIARTLQMRRRRNSSERRCAL